jgi:hypothetical protein
MNAPVERRLFQPWERFMLLSHVLEDVPRDVAGELLEPLTACAMIVVRQLMGHKTHTEAYFAIERLRDEIDRLRRQSSRRGTMEG